MQFSVIECDKMWANGTGSYWQKIAGVKISRAEHSSSLKFQTFMSDEVSAVQTESVLSAEHLAV